MRKLTSAPPLPLHADHEETRRKKVCLFVSLCRIQSSRKVLHRDRCKGLKEMPRAPNSSKEAFKHTGQTGLPNRAPRFCFPCGCRNQTQGSVLRKPPQMCECLKLLLDGQGGMHSVSKSLQPGKGVEIWEAKEMAC